MDRRMTTTVVLVGLGLVHVVGADVLLTEEAALEAMFPGVEEVSSEVVTLTELQLTAVRDQLGGKWTLYQAGGSEGATGETEGELTLYHGTSGGERAGTALMETQPGKWGPVQYVIALDNTGAVKNLAVMMYVEKRGRPIASQSFLKQFIGKTVTDPVMVGKDVRAVSGATISSRATAFAVKKVLAIYHTVTAAAAEGD